MPPLKLRRQDIAVFGTSGSGKTVLLSSFYGATQEPSFLDENVYRVRADDQAQANTLLQNYLRLKNAKVPATTRTEARSFSFTIRLKNPTGPQDQIDAANAAKTRPFDALQLVWHDYPGEWFEEEPTSEELRSRRVCTFRALLESDVAILLVDGQRLLDHHGQEEKYLRALLWGLSDGLERLQDDILTGGRLRQFPRIWIIALAKSDLHPDMSATEFRNLVIEHNAEDVTKLRNTLKEFISEDQALSVGEDFLLLSSAKFELSSTDPDPIKIEVDKRLGVDLVLPIASLLPLERLALWYTHIPIDGLGKVVNNSEELAKFLTRTAVPLIARLAAKTPWSKGVSLVAIPLIEKMIGVGQDQLEKRYEQLRANHDYLGATLTQFQLDIERGAAADVFLRSL